MSALIELAERCEAAAADMQSKLIEEAWMLIHHGGYPPEGDWDTCEKCGAFSHMLEARAYVDAALMLVPDGYRYAAGIGLFDGKPWAWCAISAQANIIHATTPALALTAAALRATASMEVE